MTATLPRTATDTESAATPERDAVVARWHALRRVVGAVAAVLAIGGGIILAWPAMAVVAVLALGIAVDATVALRSPRSNILLTLLIDITFAGVAMVVGDVPPAAIGVVVAYFVLVVAVIGDAGSVLPVGAYAVVVGIGAAYLGGAVGTAAESVERPVVSGVIVVVVFGTATVAMVREFSTIRSRGRATAGRRIEVADAVARASRALVAEDDARALGAALDAVREAMGVPVVFVERNVLDTESGLVAVVAERSSDRTVVHPSLEVHAKAPWSAMPGARAHLEGGAPFFYRVEETRGTVADRGGEGGIQVEVDIPIRLGDEWVGVIGAADTDARRMWRTDDIDLLRTMAGLTSAFWQRARDQKKRDSLIGSLNGRLRHEEAIAKASRALLGEHASHRGPALEAMGSAVGVREVVLTETVADEDGAPGATIVDVWTAPGHVGRHRAGDEWTYAGHPDTQRSLQRGEMANLRTAGTATELMAGIEVEGAWFGTVSFIDADDRRTWTERDESYLRTFADLLAAFEERQRNRDRLEDALDSKDQLIATVSHELRTPLTAVRGLADELRLNGDAFDAEERTQLLEVIAAESGEMSDLIEDLLVAARSHDGTLPVFPERIDLSLLSRSVVDHLVVPETHAVSVHDVDSVAFGDPVRVRQVVRNLVTNAFRYGGSKVTLSFGTTGEHAFVDVHDDGDGIEPDDRSAVFEPYGRARTGRRVASSIGLGLAVSRRLARLMGGDLTLEDTEGCTFRLTVPLPTPEDR